jgi:hypothetical protein
MLKKIKRSAALPPNSCAATHIESSFGTGPDEQPYRNWQSLVPEMGPHRVQFRYGARRMTVPELAEPGTGNGTIRIDIESSSGTGPDEQPYRNWKSPVPEMGKNESRSVPAMADCQFGDCTIWKFFRNGPPKRTLLEMGTITGNGSAISSTGKLCILGVTHTHTKMYSTILQGQRSVTPIIQNSGLCKIATILKENL